MPKRLIVADDSSTIQKVVELFLEQEGFEVSSAGNGEEALQLMETFVPDIVLADMEMPLMGGYELCSRIKADPRTAHIPVVILFSAFDPFDEERARAVGAQGVLAKPFESQDLLKAVQPLVGQEFVEAPPAEELTESVSAPAAEPSSEPVPESVPDAVVEPAEAPEPRWDEDIPEKEEQVSVACGLDEEWGAWALQKPLEEPEVAVSAGATEKPQSDEGETGLGLEVRQEIDSIVERVVREILTEALTSMKGVIEEALREGIPRVAEEIIRKEIEKIMASTTEDKP